MGSRVPSRKLRTIRVPLTNEPSWFCSVPVLRGPPSVQFSLARPIQPSLFLIHGTPERDGPQLGTFHQCVPTPSSLEIRSTMLVPSSTEKNIKKTTPIQKILSVFFLSELEHCNDPVSIIFIATFLYSYRQVSIFFPSSSQVCISFL